MTLVKYRVKNKNYIGQSAMHETDLAHFSWLPNAAAVYMQINGVVYFELITGFEIETHARHLRDYMRGLGVYPRYGRGYIRQTANLGRGRYYGAVRAVQINTRRRGQIEVTEYLNTVGWR